MVRTFITVESPPPDSVTWETDLGGDTATVTWHVPTAPAEATFEVVRKRPSGDTVYHHRFRYDARPVTEAHLDSLAGSRARGYGSPADSARIHQATREEMRRPPFHPPVSSTRAGEDGAFFIELNDADATVGRWVVVAADGAVRGVLSLPPSTAVRWSEADLHWAVTIDELGVPWLVRYRLPSPTPAPRVR